MNSMELGLELMLVGMLSVFVILVIIILLGKLLIEMTNRFPDVDAHAVQPDASSVSLETRTIIEAAVRELTGGKGKVNGIVKL